jgi:hypothetical protein
MGGLLVAAVACLAGAEAEAQRYYGGRDLQAEAELAAQVALLNRLTAQAAAPLTPEQRILNDMTVGRIGGAARAACEARRAAQPYSIYRPGRIQDGWYDTMTGPRPRACY